MYIVRDDEFNDFIMIAGKIVSISYPSEGKVSYVLYENLTKLPIVCGDWEEIYYLFNAINFHALEWKSILHGDSNAHYD